MELAGCNIECADSLGPEMPLSLGSLPSNMAQLDHARISFLCQDLKSCFPFLSVFGIPSIECGCSTDGREDRIEEPPGVFCNPTATHLWMLPFSTVAPLDVSERLQPQSKN